MTTEKSQNNNESFIRWQGRSIEELGKAINLLLTLTLATLGFTVAKLLGDFIFLSCSAKTLVVLGNLVLLATAFLILLTIRNRINSIRKTAQIARKREKNLTKNIEALRQIVRSLDKTTWTLFSCSVILFLIGQGLTVIGFVIEILNRQ
ncbi:MAG: hypothetical protein JST52_05350 [Bacteroidetes bacterium]|nr:hypothetical protein [Bacteroidota bacterium]MBS1739421.1 hypothetical protein [Bacteroidota bacterium]